MIDGVVLLAIPPRTFLVDISSSLFCSPVEEGRVEVGYGIFLRMVSHNLLNLHL